MKSTLRLVAELEPGQRTEFQVATFERADRISPAGLGLSIAEGKAILAAIQGAMVEGILPLDLPIRLRQYPDSHSPSDDVSMRLHGANQLLDFEYGSQGDVAVVTVSDNEAGDPDVVRQRWLRFWPKYCPIRHVRTLVRFEIERCAWFGGSTATRVLVARIPYPVQQARSSLPWMAAL